VTQDPSSSKDSISASEFSTDEDSSNYLQTLVDAIQEYHPSPDIKSVEKALNFVLDSHRGQKRASGEPYVAHLVETALLVARLRLDIPSVVAALLHDSLEDCASVTHRKLENEFGKDIADIVQGVTKLTRVKFESQEEKQAEGFRKMLLAMAKDIRVVMVKLCDRLHNMRTLFHLPDEKQRRIALETQEIYAPLANRLGIHWLKSELEDLCLLALRPEIYNVIKDNLARTRKDRNHYVKLTKEEIRSQLEEAGISASVAGRSKHFYSIWQKMERSNLAFDEVHDLHGFRVVVPTIRACYEALGVVHAAWKPVPGRFKDYIAMPKPNMYQSLHTTLIGPEGQRIEVQIRTPDMHRVAEQGIAAHWRYKETGEAHPEGDSFDLHWVKQLVEEQKYMDNPDEFIQTVKGELFPDDVFVFTPKGDLIRLPYGSTSVDFAYAIHTDVGHHIVGAKVNGSLVSIDYKLENGDTIEVLTAKTQSPSRDWLNHVRSSKAKQRIRTFLKAEEQASAMALGMELLTKDLRKVTLNLKKLAKEGKLDSLAEGFGCTTPGELYIQIGYGKLPTSKVIAKLLPEKPDLEVELNKQDSPLERIFQRAARASRQKVGVKVSGLENVLIRFAKCCEPLPGDRITGFITRGRGVTVHRMDCAQVLRSDPLRQIDVSWDDQTTAPRRVRLAVHCIDRIGLLSNVTRAITEHGANITSVQMKTVKPSKTLLYFELSIEDARQLNEITRSIEQASGVIRVERLKRSGPFGNEGETL
jgi:guanosine-3',5'-bis(diphosphate) 3'-pyrophosphohydrolase